MPLYAVSTRSSLPADAREKIAMMITDVHCGHTNAPRTFVQVTFAEHLPLQPGIDLHVQASVRAGRDRVTNDGIEKELIDRLVELTAVPLGKMAYNIFPVPAAWIMEGGVVLPDPGDEAEWLEKHGHEG